MTEGDQSALSIWKEKLEFLLQEEAKAAGPVQLFELKKAIESARVKIKEMDHGDGPSRQNPAAAFDPASDRFRVLILPFEALEESKLRETRYGRAVEKRLVEIKEEKDLDLDIKYLQDEHSPSGFREATNTGRKHNADLVIWGDYYERVHSDATHAAVKYSLVDIEPPNVSATGKTPITEIQSLTLISQGYLQHDIDYILYWVLALEKFAKEMYGDALPLFVQVESEFSDQLKGIVSFKMADKGMAFSMSLPALQLFYHLGYCYSVNRRHNKAGCYWSAILDGGTTTPGGSMIGWDTFALALSEGNESAIRVCAFALLNRAIGYQQMGKHGAAKNDFQRLLVTVTGSELAKAILGGVLLFAEKQFRNLERRNNECMTTKRRHSRLKIITLLTAAAGIVITGFLTQFGQNVANRTAPPTLLEESPTPTNLTRLASGTTTSHRPPQDRPAATPRPEEPEDSEAPKSPHEEQSQTMVEVTLMLDSKAPLTTIIIDDKPAAILETGLTYIAIKAPPGSHPFTLYRRDGYRCNFTQAVKPSTTVITPTCIWEKLQ